MSVAHGEQLRTLEEHGEEPEGRSIGWWGMIFFITSEALIFANLIAAYLTWRSGIQGWSRMGHGLCQMVILCLRWTPMQGF